METQPVCVGSSELRIANPWPSAEADDTAKKLAHIWRQVLGIESIEPDQNFFDLGGDSSLAVQMFARVETDLGIKLPLATLYEAPTIDELVHVLRSDSAANRWSSLVPIQPSGSRPPFFCIHPHGGNVLVYRELSRLLGPDQPFFGLQSQGLDGSKEPLSRIEDMAALYLSEIRTVQPNGPYFLGGYCMGGSVAYETACQLREAGEDVALLAIFDTMEFSALPRPSLLQMSYYNCQRFFFHLANVMQLDSEDRSRFFSEKIHSLQMRAPVWFCALKDKFRKPKPTDSSSKAEVLARIWDANSRAQLKYVARPYPGTVTDIRPAHQYRLLDGPQFKWDRLALGGQKIVVLPINPPAMLSDPFVKHLAEAVRKSLDEAIEESTATHEQ